MYTFKTFFSIDNFNSYFFFYKINILILCSFHLKIVKNDKTQIKLLNYTLSVFH